MSKLGIIIPVFNSEKYLVECIESVLAQSFVDWQLFLVDDGSTDSSGQICDEYARDDNRIIAIHQKNTGPILARYAGLMNANTEYVTFVDADDWIDSGTYMEAFHYMKEDVDVIEYEIKRNYNYGYITVVSHPDAGRVYRGQELNDKIRKTMVWNREKKGPSIDASLCNKLFKREFLTNEYRHAKDLSLHYGEDMAIVYPILQRCESYVFSSGGGYNHRQYKRFSDIIYVKDEHFFEKLTRLYMYLRNRLQEQIYVEQLDFFFSYSVNWYMNNYRGQRLDIQYLFPFHCVPQGARVVLYGAGKVGKAYHDELDRIPYCDVVLWVDKGKKETGVLPVEALLNADYDFVVIAVKNSLLIQNIRIDLIKMGVPENKIVWNDAEG